MYNYDMHLLQIKFTKVALLLIGVISLTMFGVRVRAQTPSGANNTIPNLNSLSGDRLNQVRPIRQPNFLIDSSRGSQQFFRQGGDNLYLLPESKSEPILKIDEALKTEEVNGESWQNKPKKE